MCYNTDNGGDCLAVVVSEAESAYLKSRDKKLGEVIDRIGPLTRPVEEDLFASVVRQIVGQQVSMAAQETVWRRISEAYGGVKAATLHAATAEELQKHGITFKKADYIKDFAAKVACGEFDIEALREKSDAEVIRELSALRGIGVWTAEMIMTFCLLRPDVLSYGDLAIHRGMRMLYRHRSVDRALFEKYRRRYSPCGTAASLYLWAVAGGAVPALRDPAPKKKAVKP